LLARHGIDTPAPPPSDTDAVAVTPSAGVVAPVADAGAPDGEGDFEPARPEGVLRNLPGAVGDVVRPVPELAKGVARGTERVAGSVGRIGQWAAERASQGKGLPLPARILDRIAQRVIPRYGKARDAQYEKANALFANVSDFWDEQAATGIESRDPKLSFKTKPFSTAMAGVGESVPLFGTAIAATAITKSPLPAAMIFGLTGGADTYTDARKAGTSMNKADVLAHMSGAWEGVSESIPFSKLLGRSGQKALSRIAKGAITEGTQEVVQEIGTNLIEKFGFDPERAALTMDSFLNSLVVGMVMGGAAGAVVKGGADEQVVAEQAKALLPPPVPRDAATIEPDRPDPEAVARASQEVGREAAQQSADATPTPLPPPTATEPTTTTTKADKPISVTRTQDAAAGALSDKPIADMTIKELRAEAKARGISAGGSSKKAIRARIENAPVIPADPARVEAQRAAEVALNEGRFNEEPSQPEDVSTLSKSELQARADELGIERTPKTVNAVLRERIANQANSTAEERNRERNLSLISEDEDVRRLFRATDTRAAESGGPRPQTIKEWDRAARKTYREAPEESYQRVISGDLDMANPVNQRLAKIAMDERAGQDLRSEDVGRIQNATQAAWNMRAAGTEIARAMAARRDPNQTPEQHLNSMLNQAILSPTDAESRILKSVDDVAKDPKVRAMIKKSARRTERTLQKLRAMGVDMNNLGTDILQDRAKVSEIMRVIQAKKACIGDKEFEYWRNAILSAPTTQAANIIGNTGNSFYEYALLKPVEAGLNALTGNRVKGAMTGKDLASIYKAILSRKTWSDSTRNAIDAFVSETPTVEGTKIEGSTAAISGKTGRVVRVPQRLLLAADEFAKTAIMQSEVGAQANMVGREKGLSGDELDKFVSQQLDDPASIAWSRSLDSAKRVTFQERGGKLSEAIIKWRKEPGPLGFAARHIAPFVVTPANIVKIGLRRTPLGTVMLPSTMWKAAKGNVSQEMAVSRIAEQVLAYAATYAVYGLVNEKDEEGRPKWLTGTSSMVKGQREAEYRGVGPQMMRIPGTDKWVSYSRIEPMATSLAAMVDVMQDTGEPMTTKTVEAVQGMVKDKTWLRGISDVMSFFDSRNRMSIDKWSSNFAASYVPNLLRSSMRAMDDNVRQYMIDDPENHWGDWLKRTGQSALPLPAFAPRPKVDLYGREIKRDQLTSSPSTDFLYRATVPIKTQTTPSFENIDRMLINYNRKFPNRKWWPSIPSAGSKDKRMSEGEYYSFLRARGAWILKMSQKANLNFDDPTEADKRAVQSIFSKATTAAKAEISLDKTQQ